MHGHDAVGAGDDDRHRVDGACLKLDVIDLYVDRCLRLSVRRCGHDHDDGNHGDEYFADVASHEASAFCPTGCRAECDEMCWVDGVWVHDLRPVRLLAAR